MNGAVFTLPTNTTVYKRYLAMHWNQYKWADGLAGAVETITEQLNHEGVDMTTCLWYCREEPLSWGYYTLFCIYEEKEN